MILFRIYRARPAAPACRQSNIRECPSTSGFNHNTHNNNSNTFYNQFDGLIENFRRNKSLKMKVRVNEHIFLVECVDHLVVLCFHCIMNCNKRF